MNNFSVWLANSPSIQTVSSKFPDYSSFIFQQFSKCLNNFLIMIHNNVA